MKRNFSEVIKALDGAPVLSGHSAESLQSAFDQFTRANPIAAGEFGDLLEARRIKPMTVAGVASQALIAALEGDDKTSLEDKAKRMKLAMRICDGGEVDVSADEITMIKARVNKAFPGALVPVRVSDHLEAEPQLAAVSPASA